MGRKSKAKNEKKKQTNAAMDPTLMKAFMRGRDNGYKDGKVEGTAEILTLFHHWTEEIDEHVKGVGTKTKLNIQEYFAKRIEQTIQKNKHKDYQ